MTDALAYCALYPENYKVERVAGDTLIDNFAFNPVIAGQKWKLVSVGEKEARQLIKKVGERVARDNPDHGLDTVTVALSQTPSFQVGIDRSSIAGNAQVSYTVAAAGETKVNIAKKFKISVSDLEQANQSYNIDPLIDPEPRNQNFTLVNQEPRLGAKLTIPIPISYARMVSFPPVLSNERAQKLLDAAGSSASPLDIPPGAISNPKDNETQQKEEQALKGVDLDDWRAALSDPLQTISRKDRNRRRVNLNLNAGSIVTDVDKVFGNTGRSDLVATEFIEEEKKQG